MSKINFRVIRRPVVPSHRQEKAEQWFNDWAYFQVHGERTFLNKLWKLLKKEN